MRPGYSVVAVSWTGHDCSDESHGEIVVVDGDFAGVASMRVLGNTDADARTHGAD